MPDIDLALSLPIGFQFTQSKLQDFEDCARRFYLKYILEQNWPSPIAEPQAAHEEAIHRGIHFHKLVERNQLGISLDTLRKTSKDSIIHDWLDNYEKLLQQFGQFERAWPEVLLSTTIADYSLAAKFDLIALQNKKIIAIDWKTGHLPANRYLEERMQTSVYLYVLHKEVHKLAEISPESITLTYVNISDKEIRSFARENAKEFEQRILNVIEAINDSDFSKVKDSHPCRFCVYRGLCERGTTPDIAVGQIDVETYWQLDTDSTEYEL